MDSAGSREGRRDAIRQIEESKECVRRSLELIKQSDEIIRECEDLFVMVHSASLDSTDVRERFHMFYEVPEEDPQL